MAGITARLEKLERRSELTHVRLLVNMRDGTQAEMSAKEFCETPAEKIADGRNIYIVLAGGENRKEMLMVTDKCREIIKEIFQNPQPNRNIEDYE